VRASVYPLVTRIVSLATRSDVGEILERAGITASVRSGRLRLAFHLNNNIDDADEPLKPSAARSHSEPQNGRCAGSARAGTGQVTLQDGAIGTGEGPSASKQGRVAVRRPTSRSYMGTALRQQRLGQRLCQPVLGVLTVVEGGHLLVAEGRIQRRDSMRSCRVSRRSSDRRARERCVQLAHKEGAEPTASGRRSNEKTLHLTNPLRHKRSPAQPKTASR